MQIEARIDIHDSALQFTAIYTLLQKRLGKDYLELQNSRVELVYNVLSTPQCIQVN